MFCYCLEDKCLFQVFSFMDGDCMEFQFLDFIEYSYGSVFCFWVMCSASSLLTFSVVSRSISEMRSRIKIAFPMFMQTIINI